MIKSDFNLFFMHTQFITSQTTKVI